MANPRCNGEGYIAHRAVERRMTRVLTLFLIPPRICANHRVKIKLGEAIIRISPHCSESLFKLTSSQLFLLLAVLGARLSAVRVLAVQLQSELARHLAAAAGPIVRIRATPASAHTLTGTPLRSLVHAHTCTGHAYELGSCRLLNSNIPKLAVREGRLCLLCNDMGASDFPINSIRLV